MGRQSNMTGGEDDEDYFDDDFDDDFAWWPNTDIYIFMIKI